MPQKKRGQTPVEEAVARILNALDVPEKTEEIPLLQALGRVAAGDVCARVAQPPFDRSALDGYALRAADIAAAGPESRVSLPVSRYLCAGSDPGGPLAPGTAARIMTGAPVPAGADCVLRQEDTESNGQTVTFHAPVEARANVCFAGEDIAPGKCLVPAGTRLDEVSLGLLAGQGVQTVTVYAQPRAALMPTGDELCSPETPLRPGKIYDSNGPMLAARMLRLGAEPTLLAAGPDDPAALAAQGFKGGTRGATEWAQWVQSEKEQLAAVMERYDIQWEQKGTHEKHLSVMDYKKQEREKEIAALDSTLAEKQDELETVQSRIDNFDQGVQSIEKLEQRIESDAEFQLPDPPTLMTAKTYKQRFVDPLIRRLKEIIREMFCRYYKALDSYHRLNTTNGRLYRENEHLTAANDRLKGENEVLRSELKDFRFLRKVLGSRQIDNLIAQAKDMEQQRKQTQRTRRRNTNYER